jgi:hypothetical protein
MPDLLRGGEAILLAAVAETRRRSRMKERYSAVPALP